ncbi:putative WRKY transcription factor 35 [Cucumis melo var. makuwa]|uniref:WRKY transcription factor 35 n=1 Tax=Cucumis melo var. makuwa TaxID=1194695 RepID=A0A5A7UBC1_CUCMM|nr:putative WRKY transcription factor 35 [Cucumis melo var. makuwa]
MLQISPSSNKFQTISSLTNNSPPPSNFLISNHSPTTTTTPLHPDHHLHHFLHHHDQNNNNNNNNTSAALHISSPRNPPGIKRRKSQARKVVCVPAPVAASSRPNGEVIPSDLWAWRKYGQKPIKGGTIGAAAQKDVQQENKWREVEQIQTCW